MTYDEKLFSIFTTKVMDVPIVSNNTLVIKSSQIDKSYKMLNDEVKELGSNHMDAVGLKTICFQTNIAQ